MSLTIVQFTWGLKAAGKERVVVDLAKGFDDLGHKSVVCTLLARTDLVKELQESGITFKCFRLTRTYDLSGLIPIMKYIRNLSPDAVITHGASGSLLPRVVTILAGVPACLYVEHTLSVGKKSYHLLMNRIFYLFTDKIVCVSEEVRRSILQAERPKAEKVVTVRNGLHTGRFLHTQNGTCRKDGCKRVGIVGRFYEEKGHVYFVEAAKIITKSVKNIEFVFVGDGHLKPIIVQKVKDCQIEEYCRFVGVTLAVETILQTLDVFVLSSLYEGLPVSLLEAQYFGVASVVTDVGGVPEVIENGYNGLLVPPKDPQKLASEIIRVLTNDKLRDYLGANGRKVFNEKFTIDKTAQSYTNLIYSILDR